MQVVAQMKRMSGRHALTEVIDSSPSHGNGPQNSARSYGSPLIAASKQAFSRTLDILAHIACYFDGTVIKPGVVPSAFVKSRSNPKQIFQGVWKNANQAVGWMEEIAGSSRRSSF